MSAIPTSSIADSDIDRVAGELVNCSAPGWVDFSQSWRRLSDDQFMAAMRLVLAEEPHKVAAAWAQVQKRLTDCEELRTQLLSETIAHVKSIDRLAFIDLEQAPLDIRLAILTGLDPLPAHQMRDEKWWDQHVPALELLVDALYQLDATARSQLLNNVYPKFNLVHPVVMYRAVRQCIRKQEAKGHDFDGHTKLWLMLTAETWLAEAGYKRGRIQMGMHKSMSQPYIMEDGERRKFVLDRRSHRFYPGEDDEVLFKPDQGRVLVDKPNFQVVAVFFIPAV